jgi:hypothetical protein
MSGPGCSLHNIHYRTHHGSGRGWFPAVPALVVLQILIAGCTPVSVPGNSSPSGPTGPVAAASSSGPTGPGPTAEPPAAPAAPPAPPPSLPTTAVEARLGTAATPLPTDGSPAPDVDSGSTFEVRLPFAARGARLVLLDARDAMVPSSSDVQVGAASRFTLVPLEPLLPGSRHVLRLEGLESRLVRADDGRTFEPLAAPFRVAGEPPPAPPKKGKKKRAR